MNLILVLPNGAVVRDSDWHVIGDVMKSFHSFKVRRVYGQIQTEEGVALTQMVPMPVDVDAECSVKTSQPLG